MSGSAESQPPQSRTGSVKLVIDLPAPLITPNTQRQMHWTKVRDAKAQTELLVKSAITKAKLKKIDPPISVRLIWYAPDIKRRDADSLAPTMKAVLDALVKKGVIPDDNSTIVGECLLGPIIVSRDNPRLEVRIMGLEEGWRVQFD